MTNPAVIVLLLSLIAAVVPGHADELRYSARGKKAKETVQRGYLQAFDGKDLTFVILQRSDSKAPFIGMTPEATHQLMAEYTKHAGEPIPGQQSTLHVAGLVVEITLAADDDQGIVGPQITNSYDDKSQSHDLLSESASDPVERDWRTCKGPGSDWIVKRESAEKLTGTIAKIEKGYVYFTKARATNTQKYLLSNLSSVGLNSCK